MTKRSLCTALLAAGCLLAGGCSSNTTGSATAVATSSSAQSSAAVSESSAESSGAAVTTGSAASGSAVPAVLDAQTTAWFTTLCTGIAPILKLGNGTQTAGKDPAAQQQAGVQLLDQFGTALVKTGAELQKVPPPTFDGGGELATQLTSGLAESGGTIGALAKSYGAIDPADTAALEKATKELSTQLTAAAAPLQAISKLDPSISAAVQQIPACAATGG